jgi:hypothetical protein
MKANLLQTASLGVAMRRIVFAGLVGHAALAFSAAALAEEPAPAAEASDANTQPINLEFSDRAAPSTAHFDIAPARAAGGEAQGPRRFGYVLSANGGAVGVPMGLSVSQHVTVGEGGDGAPSRQGRGAEVRVGGVIADLRGQGGNGNRDANWYIFAASDDEAVTWRPGSQRDAAGGAAFALQDHVEIGDMQAGVTVETRGVQASLAYVERQVSTHVGTQGFSQDESFAGLTVTMRR